MAKKNKPLKIKQYQIPPEKFIVVINPWGVYNNFDAADLNQISAWFEIMLRDVHPNTRPRTIYYQRTHKNIILEFPQEVNVEGCLGAHFYSKFFVNAQLGGEDVAYIYEYKYETFGDPSIQSFFIGHAMYDAIPNNFPIKYPYPLPSPAPPPPYSVAYARPISHEKNQRISNRLGPLPAPPTDQDTSTFPASATPRIQEKGKARSDSISTENVRFMPYVRPAYLTSEFTKKVNSSNLSHHLKEDPDDAEQRAKLLLKISLDNDSDALTEKENTETKYIPSAELLDALGTLPDLTDSNAEEPIKVKTEPDSVDYQPSGELLSLLASLPDDIGK